MLRERAVDGNVQQASETDAVQGVWRFNPGDWASMHEDPEQPTRPLLRVTLYATGAGSMKYKDASPQACQPPGLARMAASSIETASCSVDCADTEANDVNASEGRSVTGSH